MSKTILNAIFTPGSFAGAALAAIAFASPAARADEPAATAPGVVPTTAPAATTPLAPAAPATGTAATPAPAEEHAPPAPAVAQSTPPPGSGNSVEATPETPAEEAPAPELTLNGSIDAYSGVNFTNPDSGVNKLRAFDTADRGFALNYAELVLARSKGPIGFRFDAGFGAASDALFAVDNASVSMDSTTVDTAKVLAHIQQAYVTGKIGDVTLDLGKFVTMHGYEVIETKDNWNYSRSVLFTWAIPFLHTGLRATYPVNDKLSVMGCWTNGWNTNIEDGNSMTDVGLQAIYKPVTPLSIVFNYMGGREHALGVEELTIRHLVDVSASYAVNDQLSLAVNADYGHDAASNGVSWAGVAGYGRYQILPWLAAAARAEYFTDPDGFMTTVQQKLIEGTATAEVSGKIGPTAVLGRLEYRHDHSDTPFFDAMMPTTKKDQDTVLLGAVAAF
ncbi:MAG TPA: porin [Kofleriaceae bacterium]